MSVQLMGQRQRPDESIDAFVQDFESMFGRRYGRQTGMDEAFVEKGFVLSGSLTSEDPSII